MPYQLPRRPSIAHDTVTRHPLPYRHTLTPQSPLPSCAYSTYLTSSTWPSISPKPRRIQVHHLPSTPSNAATQAVNTPPPYPIDVTLHALRPKKTCPSNRAPCVHARTYQRPIISGLKPQHQTMAGAYPSLPTVSNLSKLPARIHSQRP